MEIPSVVNNSQLHTAHLCASEATLFVLPSLYVLIFLTGLPGNALSLWVFLGRIPNQTSTHVYLTHLGLSNLLLCLTAPFQAAYYLQGQVWLSDSPLCQMVIHGVTPIQQINIYVGVFILTWVALSRFATLIQHTHASRPSAFATLLPHAFFTTLRRARFAKAVCAGVWVVVVGGIVPVTVYYSVKEANDVDGARGHRVEESGEKACYNVAVELGGSLSRGSSVAAIVVFFVCFLLVMTSYVSVARHVRRSRRSAAINDSQQLLGKVFRNIVVIQVVLIVCLLPHHIFKSIFISIVENQDRADLATTRSSSRDPCHKLSNTIEVKNFLLCLASIRCSVDPVMYFLLDKTFHKNISSMFRLSLQKPNSQSLDGTTSQAEARANRTGERLKEACHKGQGPRKDSTTVDWSEDM